MLSEDAPTAPVAAEEHFLQSLDWARRQNALSWELRTATSFARFSRDQGRDVEARSVWRPSTTGSQRALRPATWQGQDVPQELKLDGVAILAVPAGDHMEIYLGFAFVPRDIKSIFTGAVTWD